MKFRGGARLGIFNATWPFATLALDPKHLRLTVLGTIYEFPKDEVQALEYYRGWFSTGVRIIRGTAANPSHIVFWSFRAREVLSAAETAGFRIKT